jgi:hypothetical protein
LIKKKKTLAFCLVPEKKEKKRKSRRNMKRK